MDATQQALDVARFRKIVAMARARTHDGRDNANERENAWNIARATAERAGLTLEDALARLDGQSCSQATANERAEREKRQWAADEARRERAEAEARSKPKPPPPEFDEHPMERAIREALVRNAIDPSALTKRRQLKGLHFVIARAIPWPKTLRDMIDEVRAWDGIEDARRRIDPTYTLLGGPYVRRQMVEADLILDPAACVADAMARLAWVREQAQDHVPEDRRLDPGEAFWAIADDMEKIAKALRQAKQAERTPEAASKRTREASRAAVLRILREPGGMSLSLREVASRAGVSPQTVSNIKARFNVSNLDPIP